MTPWDNFLSFYRDGYGGSNAVNTGDWAVIDNFDDDMAAGLYRSVTGIDPRESSCPLPVDFLVPPLPQGFYAMEHFNFPTVVHKLTKPIFNEADLPDEDDPAFHTFPWHNELTKSAEATNNEAIHPHKPGNTSGITLGRGFDLSKFTSNRNIMLNVLRRVGIEDKLITDAVGLSISDANAYWAAHKAELQSLTITAEQQYLLSLYAFEVKETNIHNMPGATSGVVSLYDEYIKGDSGAEWRNLDQRIQDVLFDLHYRGDFHDVSENTTQKTSTPFDDVAFARSFRDAVRANSVGGLCRVISSPNWLFSPWGAPKERRDLRSERLGAIENICP